MKNSIYSTLKKRSLLLLLFTAMIVATSCSSDDDMDDANGMEPEKMLLKGDFVNDAHPTSGQAKVDETRKTLSFENFKTDSGPKLLVYLAVDNVASDYVDLGDLKGIEGNFTYDIPANTDLEKYDHVLIWCVDFSVNFGYAVLK